MTPSFPTRTAADLAAAGGNPDPPGVVTPAGPRHAGRIRQAPRQAQAAALIDVAVPRAPVLGLAPDRAVAVAASRIVAAGIAIARIAAIRIASVTVVAGISVSDAARQTGRRKRDDESDCNLHGKFLAAIGTKSTSSM